MRNVAGLCTGRSTDVTDMTDILTQTDEILTQTDDRQDSRTAGLRPAGPHLHVLPEASGRKTEKGDRLYFSNLDRERKIERERGRQTGIMKTGGDLTTDKMSGGGLGAVGHQVTDFAKIREEGGLIMMSGHATGVGQEVGRGQITAQLPENHQHERRVERLDKMTPIWS